MSVVAAATGLAVILAQWLNAPRATEEVDESSLDWSAPEDGSMAIFLWIFGAIILFAVVHFVRERLRK